VISLELTEDEALLVHHALSTTIQLIDVADPPDHAPLNTAAGPKLVEVARRLDHERRHAGPNPHGIGSAA
jgi:hypothetical protein